MSASSGSGPALLNFGDYGSVPTGWLGGGRQTFSGKGQILNILGFVASPPVSQLLRLVEHRQPQTASQQIKQLYLWTLRLDIHMIVCVTKCCSSSVFFPQPLKNARNILNSQAI